MPNLHLALANIATVHIGIKEVGGNNRGKMVEEFQKALDGKAVGEPWCACFVAYCVKQIEAQERVRSKLTLSEHCMTMWRSNPARQKAKPFIGAIVIWRKKGSDSGHTGIVTSFNAQVFQTVEGNTSDGSGLNRDGDGVYRRSRHLGGVPGFDTMGFLDPW